MVLRFKKTSFVNKTISEGMGPERQLVPNSNSVSEVRVPRADGMVPTKRLTGAYKYDSFVKVRNEFKV